MQHTLKYVPLIPKLYCYIDHCFPYTWEALLLLNLMNTKLRSVYIIFLFNNPYCCYLFVIK